tara:strand:- start:19 stop:384 length:366 start_codon:yes stop_codon:yes gene_type:complete
MIVLDRTQTISTISFIPRSYVPTGANIFKVIVKNEEQNTTNSTATVSSFTAVDYFYTYAANIGLDQNKDQTYTLEITDTNQSKVIYRDKIFGTNQAVSTYSPNTGKFKSNTTGLNDYLVYE